jgi:hypothetical protein
MGVLRLGAKVLLGLVALVFVAVGWTMFAWGLSTRLAHGDLDEVATALRTAAADGVLTKDEIRAAGAHSSHRHEDGTVEVLADSGEPPWWTPVDFNVRQFARYTVRGGEVDVEVGPHTNYAFPGGIS